MMMLVLIKVLLLVVVGMDYLNPAKIWNSSQEESF
jgi:hypothetical protein